MADRYSQLVNTPIGRIVTKQIGLPNPPRLERYEPGQPVIEGPVLFGAAADSRGDDRTAAHGHGCVHPERPRRHHAQGRPASSQPDRS